MRLDGAEARWIDADEINHRVMFLAQARNRRRLAIVISRDACNGPCSENAGNTAIELDGLIDPRIVVDVFANASCRLRRHGLDVVRIDHVNADGLGHQFAWNVRLGISGVLRTREAGGSLLSGIERIVKLAQLDVQTFGRDLAGQFVERMTNLMRDDFWGLRWREGSEKSYRAL